MKKVIDFIQVTLILIFMVTTSIGMIVAACWSHDSFNWPLIISLLSYLGFYFTFKWAVNG